MIIEVHSNGGGKLYSYKFDVLVDNLKNQSKADESNNAENDYVHIYENIYNNTSLSSYPSLNECYQLSLFFFLLN